MSVQALTWAFKQTIRPSAAKFVLVALANYASDDLYCYPSQKTLGKMTGQSDRSVRTHLSMLERDGYIERESRFTENGAMISDGYYLRLSPVAKSSGGPEIFSASPGNAVRTLRKETAAPPETVSYNTKEDSKENTKEDTESVSQHQSQEEMWTQLRLLGIPDRPSYIRLVGRAPYDDPTATIELARRKLAEKKRQA